MNTTNDIRDMMLHIRIELHLHVHHLQLVTKEIIISGSEAEVFPHLMVYHYCEFHYEQDQNYES